MSLTRRIAAAAAIATIGVVSFGASAQAAVTDGYGTGAGAMKWYGVNDSGNLVNLSDNNIGPFQACNVQAPVNGQVGQVAGNILAVVGVSQNTNTVTAIGHCSQNTAQNHGDGGSSYGSRQAGHKAARNAARSFGPQWYKVNDSGNLVNVADNNVGPVQACNIQAPVNGQLGQVAGNLGTVFGLAGNTNTVTAYGQCGQNTAQNHNS